MQPTENNIMCVVLYYVKFHFIASSLIATFKSHIDTYYGDVLYILNTSIVSTYVRRSSLVSLRILL